MGKAARGLFFAGAGKPVLVLGDKAVDELFFDAVGRADDGAAVTLSGLAIAALCGVILNAILPGNDYEFGVSVTGDKSADLGSY